MTPEPILIPGSAKAPEHAPILAPPGTHYAHPRHAAPLIKLLRFNLQRLRRFPIRRAPLRKAPKSKRKKISNPFV